MKVIKLNGIEYIKLSEYDKLKKTKVKIKTEIKEVEKKIELKDYYILDKSNVLAIVPLERNKEVGEEIELSIGFFKRVSEPEITKEYDKRWNCDVVQINDTRLSEEYVEQIKKIAKVWDSFDSWDLEIYMRYDKEKQEFLKDNPVMFLSGNLCFLLAPRIEGEK